MLSFFSSTMLFFFACSGSDDSEKADQPQQPEQETVDMAEAYKDLREGKLSKADSQFKKAVSQNAADVDAATGAAFTALLQGDYSKADKYLEAAQDEAPKKISMRRALVALQAGKYKEVKDHGLASGMDQGKLLAAEVMIIEDEENVIDMLSSLNFKNKSYTDLRDQYLKLLKSSNWRDRVYAQTQADWALGKYKGAVEEAADKLPDMTMKDKAPTLLLWAGRAAGIGDWKSATTLLNAIGRKKSKSLPRNLRWRYSATDSLIQCAKRTPAGISSCVDFLLNKKKVKSFPNEGLVNAKVTAASLISDVDPESAKRLISGIQNNSAAQVFAAVGDTDAASDAASGLYSKMLE